MNDYFYPLILWACLTAWSLCVDASYALTLIGAGRFVSLPPGKTGFRNWSPHYSRPRIQDHSFSCRGRLAFLLVDNLRGLWLVFFWSGSAHLEVLERDVSWWVLPIGLPWLSCGERVWALDSKKVFGRGTPAPFTSRWVSAHDPDHVFFACHYAFWSTCSKNRFCPFLSKKKQSRGE